ncbi:uncharacterized protein [Dendrobates tinctorius]|uniref:uncharacterized protein n=1 Tax=Dendrobates tinctorius TaxID=92724 RepID=UPI003CC9E66A
MNIRRNKKHDIQSQSGIQAMFLTLSHKINVRDFQAIWDPSDEAYKDRYYRDHCWTKVLRRLYPDWDSCNNATQLQIEKDVKQRWRSVKDRFHKYVASCNKSGSSPTRHSFPFYEELQFLLTGRTLRSTQGNIDPPAEEDSEEASGPSNVAAVTGSSAGEHVAGAAPLSSDAVASASTIAENGLVAETVRGRAGGTVSEQPNQKKTKKKNEDKTIKAANETQAMIKRSSTEDEFDFFALQIANKARSLPPDRQNIFTSLVQMSLTALHDPAPILPYDEILMSVLGLFRKKNQGQPLNAQSQGSHPYTTELLGPPPNHYTQDAATNYGYYPQYHNLN